MTDTISMPLPGQPAPELKLDLIIGLDWILADQSPDAFTMIVFYRGLHCPICKGYLQGLREHYDEWLDAGVEVINVSMDGKDKATQAHEDWGLDPIPMGYGLTEETARAWGLYLSTARAEKEPPLFSEPAMTLVRPDGRVYAHWQQSVPFARPRMADLLGAIGFIVENDYPARGIA